ncbi:MAG: hypothetical protein DRO99_02555 [Candidatus Aenigmatarchaeota archaeon]|nr:MAG: hypothetical protein DRO99_02555 [Candidatus Aenigmarchaeota archaeon]
MLGIFQAFMLGVIQGITEWLPVSSSGHLAIAQNYMGLNLPVSFDIALHVATLLVILLFFRKDVVGILTSLLRRDFRTEHGRLFLLIALGSIPTAIIGFALKGFFESMFADLHLVGGALLITGVLLVSSGKRNGSKNIGKMSAALMGLAQGFSVAPGISRSGATISAALFLGVDRMQAIRYSFLLAVPAILGAMLFELGSLSSSGIGPAPIASGFMASLAVGYFSLRLVIRAVMRRWFRWFAVYCFTAGLALLLLA